jgi:hypothetical protein
MRDNHNLLASVLPWQVSADKYEKVKWWAQPTPTHAHPRSQDQILQVASRGTLTQRTAAATFAVKLLKFPRSLGEYMSNPDRPFIIWDDNQAELPCLETRALRTILSCCTAPRPAREVSPQDQARVIFIHVGALSTLYRLPLLAERRGSRYDLSFYLYGSHPNVHPLRWGIREIFILGMLILTFLHMLVLHNIGPGGVVTFTVKSLLEDPCAVCDLIRRIDKHPHWVCFILPCVLAAAAKLSAGRGDPLSQYDELVSRVTFTLAFTNRQTVSP